MQVKTLFGKWIQLSFADKLLLLQAFLALTAVSLAMTFVPYLRVKNTLARFAPTSEGAENAHLVERCVWAVNQTSLMVRRGQNCLVKAAGLHLLLALRKVPSDLKMGFAKTASGIEGHAWLEYHGAVLVGDNGDLHLYGRST